MSYKLIPICETLCTSYAIFNQTASFNTFEDNLVKQMIMLEYSWDIFSYIKNSVKE